MQKSGFQLTNHELVLLRDDEFLPAKRRLVKKLEDMLHELGAGLMAAGKHHKLGESGSYKVSKGENYRDLPYLVLDVPGLKGPEPKALRIVIWWGRYATVNLLLSAGILVKVREQLLNGKSKAEYYYNWTDLWENELETDRYEKDISKIDWQAGQLRISVKAELDKLDGLEARALEMMELLG